MSLSPYSGEWNTNVASHLLRRTSFCTRQKNIDQAIIDGLDNTVDKILSYKLDNEPPLNPSFENDPNVAIGETWVDAPYSNIPGLSGYRRQSLGAWIVKKMMEDDVSIVEKMTLFWHNHFVVADINDARFIYRNYALMRDQALGDFRQLVKDVTIDPSMLRYLNGKQNSKQAPNENYARELMELFTLGKGNTVGPGDYTTFTEDDVLEMAKVLTGWVDTGHNNQNGIPVGSVFVAARHDTSTKVLSHRFNNAEIQNQDELEYETLIDIIFEKEEVSTFLVRKLYRWFVASAIDDAVESDIIEPLAQIFRENDYDVSSVLSVLLRSEHFYSNCSMGAMIKSPIDFILNSFGLFETSLEFDSLERQYRFYFGLLEGAAILQQSVYNHPTVAGWKAYYQAPLYYRSWVNSVTLPLRSTVMDILWLVGVNAGGGQLVKLDAFKILDYVSDPGDINILVEEIGDMVFPRTLNENQKNYLKTVVLQGLPDFEWNVEYTDYIVNPDDENIALSIENKLRLLFLSVTRLPEYHLS